MKSRLTDKVLQSFYARNRDKYAGGRWEVSQIFLKMDPKDDTSVGIAELRMNDIVSELRDASSIETAFAAAAREHSDAGTSNDGGKIGWVEGNGDLPSAVMKSVREAKIGKVTGPIRSPLGLHLILVHQFQRKDVAFEELTDHALLRRDAADALFEILLKAAKRRKDFLVRRCAETARQCSYHSPVATSFPSRGLPPRVLSHKKRAVDKPEAPKVMHITMI